MEGLNQTIRQYYFHLIFPFLLFLWGLLHFVGSNWNLYNFNISILFLLLPSIPLSIYLILIERLKHTLVKKLLFSFSISMCFLLFLAIPLISKYFLYVMSEVDDYSESKLAFVGTLSGFQKEFIIFILIIACFLTFVFYKAYKKLPVLILIVFNLSSLTNIVLAYYGSNLVSNYELLPDQQDIKFRNKYNVYYLTTETMPSFENLEKFYGYDSSQFTHYLRNLHFNIYPSAHSNYGTTNLSIGTTFTMKHSSNHGKLLGGSRSIFSGYNPVFKIFENNGYQTYSNIICHSNSGCLIKNQEYTYKFENYLHGYLSVYFTKTMVRQFYTKLGFDVPSIASFNLQNQDHLYRNKTFVGEHPQQVKFIEAQDSYTFLHSHNIYYELNQCKNQWECYMSEFEQAIDIILAKQKKSIIILQGDHGDILSSSVHLQNRKKVTTKSQLTDLERAEIGLGILQAVYWPDACSSYRKIKKIAPVNLFKYVFGCLQGLEAKQVKNLLPDDSYLNYSIGSKAFLKIYPRARKNGLFLQKWEYEVDEK